MLRFDRPLAVAVLVLMTTAASAHDPTPGPTSTATPPGPTATATPVPHFVDNGDGTVTDNQTGLQWEKKDTAVGSGKDLARAHDVDNTYSWSGFITTNGSGFLDQLNNCVSVDGSRVNAGGFAGHCDWRLPTIQQLQTIVDATQGSCGGGSGACIDSVFGPTAAGHYWSATSYVGNPNVGWLVYFRDGSVAIDFKFNDSYVRAVRTGS
jgi:hypothetical protein